VHIHPALQLQNAPQNGKHSTQAEANHWNANKVTEQSALPCWIQWLITTRDWTSDNTTLTTIPVITEILNCPQQDKEGKNEKVENGQVYNCAATAAATTTTVSFVHFTSSLVMRQS